MEFEENDGSQVGQDGVCAGDVTPSEAIKSMGVGLFRPTEGPPLVEPSPTLDHHDHEDSSDDDDQEQEASPPPADHGLATGEPESPQHVPSGGANQDHGQDHSPHHDHGGAHNDDQDHSSSQDEDENHGDDQVVFEGSPSETQSRIQAKVD